jgi:hypothetical protein
MNNLSTFHNGKQPVYRSDGKVVGYTERKTLYKTVRGEKHMLQRPRGWAWDTEIIEEADRRGVSRVEIYDCVNQKTYIASIKDFWVYGVCINRGFGNQICLPIKWWEIVLPGKPPAKQLAFEL